MANRTGQSSLTAASWVSAGVALMMIAQQIGSKAVRDGFFLDAFDVTALPVAAAAASALSFIAALVLGRVMRDFPPAASVPVIFWVNALLFFVEARFVGEHDQVIAGFLYLHVAAFSGAVVSGFWSVVNERFDPHTAKDVMGRVAGGATIGGMVGGVATWLVADLQPSQILDGLGVINLLCGLVLPLVARASTTRATTAGQSAGVLDGVRVLAHKSYPRSVALLVFLTATTTACFDYVFKASVTEASAQDESLVGFFAIFYTATGIATFLVQVLGSRRVLKWFGVVPTIGSLPVVASAFLFGALVFPGRWALILLRGATMVVENSLYRSGYELLYTPIPTEQKRSAKVLIDLGCDRLGGAAGAGIALVLIAAAAAVANQLLVVIALILALATVALLFVVRTGYVDSLAARIRRGVGRAEPQDGDQLDTYYALALTFAGDAASFRLPSRDSIADASLRAVTATDAHSTGATDSESWSREALVSRIREHGRVTAPSRIRLPASPAPAQVSSRLLQTPVLALLSRATREDETGQSLAALRISAPATLGQLTDILLSTRHPLATRLLAADLLSTVPTGRTVAGLESALRAREFRLRRAAAIALLRIVVVAPEIRPSNREMIKLAREELWHPTSRAISDAPIELSSQFRTDARGCVLAPSLEHVFTLLAIASDPDALRLALTAVTSPDPAQRGTGLEYLDNLLPIDVRARLVAMVEQPEEIGEFTGIERRVLGRLAAQLRRREISLAELRARYRSEKRTRYEAASSA